MGWEDGTPEAPPMPAGAPALEPWQMGTPEPLQAPREASGALESIRAGWQGSAPGLAWRRTLPDLVTNPEHSRWWERALTGVTQVAAELPLMVAGSAIGAPAGAALGSAVTGPAAPAGAAVGSVLGAGAGMFALPAAIRESLIQAYRSGDISTGTDFWSALRDVAATTAKEAGIGALTMGAGGLAARAAGSALAPAIGTAVSVPTAIKAIGAADVAAQIATMTSIPAALQGRLPDAQEFMDAAIVIGGLKAAHTIAGRIADVYARTGRTPAEQAADAQADPTIADDLLRAANAERTGTSSGVPLKLDRLIAQAELLGRGGVQEADTRGLMRGAAEAGKLLPQQNATALDTTLARAEMDWQIPWAPDVKALIRDIKRQGPLQPTLFDDVTRLEHLADAAGGKTEVNTKVTVKFQGTEDARPQERTGTLKEDRAGKYVEWDDGPLLDNEGRDTGRVKKSRVYLTPDVEVSPGKAEIVTTPPRPLTGPERTELADLRTRIAAGLHDQAVSRETGLARIYEDVRTKMLAANRTPEEATAIAMLERERYRARAERVGEDPADLYFKRPIQIRGEEPPAPETEGWQKLQPGPGIPGIKPPDTYQRADDVGTRTMTMREGRVQADRSVGEYSVPDAAGEPLNVRVTTDHLSGKTTVSSTLGEARDITDMLRSGLSIPEAIQRTYGAAEAATRKEVPQAPKTALRGMDDPEIRDEVKMMAYEEAGWLTEGGKLDLARYVAEGGTLDAYGRPEKLGIVAFTKWIPKAEWWPGRPDKTMDEAKYRKAVDKALAGEKLSPAEQRAIDYLVEVANKRVGTIEALGNEEFGAVARDLIEADLEPTTQNVVDADAVARAAAIDEARVERLAIEHADNDVDFMKAIRGILDEKAAQEEAAARGEAPAGGETDAGTTPGQDGNPPLTYQQRDTYEAIPKELPPGALLYHGTQAKIDALKGITYLTTDPREAAVFARGEIPGTRRGTEQGAPRVFEARTDGFLQVKNVDDTVQEEIMDGGDIDGVIKAELAKAEKEGYGAIAFSHPSGRHGGDFAAIVPTHPGELSISPTPMDATKLYQRASIIARARAVLKRVGEDKNPDGTGGRVSNETAERLAKAHDPDAGVAALLAYVGDDFTRLTGDRRLKTEAARALAYEVKAMPANRTGPLYRVLAFETEAKRQAYIDKINAGDITGLQTEAPVMSFTTDNPMGMTPMSHIGLDVASQFGDHAMVIMVQPKTGSTLTIGRDVSALYSGTLGGGAPGLDVLVPRDTQFTLRAIEEHDGRPWVILEPTRGIENPRLFQGAKQDAVAGTDRIRGAYTPGENLVELFRAADRSTALHELGHSWLEELKADAALPNASEQLRADWETARRELAIPANGEIGVASHEQWARSVERYVSEGRAPSTELAGLFARFREWLMTLWSQIRERPVEVSPDLRAVLDRMLATDQQIQEAQDLGVPRAYVEVAKAEAARKIIPGDVAKQAAEKPFADELPPGPGEAPDKIHVNYKYINTPTDLKLAMQRLAELDQAEIQRQRGGVEGVKSWAMANAEQQQYLNDVLGGGEDTLHLFAARDPNAPQIDVRLGVMKKLVVGAAKEAERLRDVVLEHAFDATVQEQLEYMGSLERLRMLQAEFLGERAGVARALNALKDTTEGSGEISRMLEVIGVGKLFQRTPAEENAYLKAKLDEIMLNYKGKSVLDIAKLHKEIGNLKGTFKIAKEAAQASTWDKIIEAWKSGLLSGPVTHVTNLFGTGAFQALRPVVDTVAAGIGIARGAKPGERLMATEGIARLTGWLGGTQDAAKLAWHTFQLDQTTGKTESYRNAIEGRKGDIIRIPLRAMAAEDALVNAMYERGELWTLAMQEAAKRGLDPRTREFAELVTQLKDSPTPEMKVAAEEAATRMTFNADLGEKGRYLQLFVNKWHLQWMIPFIRTPINIAKELGRLSPAAPLVGEWRAAIAKGGIERDRALAELAIGSGIMTLAASWAFSGNLSGAGSPDQGKNRAKVGVWQPYSVLVGDTWYEYARIQPVGTLIGLAADMANVWDHMTDEEMDKVPKMLAIAFSNAVTNQTFLQGITNFVNALSDPTRFAPQFGRQLAASAVPNIVGQPTAMADPVVREVNSMLEAVQARIPGARQQLLAKRDWLGEPVETKERLGVASPIRQTTVSTDKVRQEAARLDLSVAAAPKKMHIGKGSGKLGDVELTPEERDKFETAGGQMAHAILTNIVNAPGYDQMPDLVKRTVFHNVLAGSHRFAAAMALPVDKKMAYIQQITERMTAELQPQPQE